MKESNILIVEDERIVAYDLRTTLQRAGYHVTGLATSGEDAIRIAEGSKPDLVLMDIVLQGEMDGISAADRIREKLGIPTIYLSSYGDQSILERAKATEPIGYVFKPYEEKDLLTTIQVALYQYQTNRHRAEAALLSSETRFRSIFETAPLGIALVNREGRLVETNPVWKQMFGFADNELRNKNVCELIHSENRAFEGRQFSEVFEEKRERYQALIRGVRKDGTVIWMRASASPFQLADKKIGSRYSLCMAEDITQEKQVEEEFLRAQRMESIGTLASGLAHNLNNLLCPVVMGLPLIRSSITDDSMFPVLTNMENSTNRAVEIIRQLLHFGKGVQGKPEVLKTEGVLAETVQLIRGFFPRAIRIHTQVPSDIWSIRADANQLQQALLNLCTNAKDAMPDGGDLTVSAANANIDVSQARLHTAINAGPYVVMSVADTGMGMTPEVMDRIFHPFFTTKPTGKGTGLGLVSTLNIIKQHGGFIETQSELHKGTAFRIYLPAIPKCESEPALMSLAEA
jgi:two-component system, cell cycle sensor histidine kinase and response regulator CckA